MGRFFIVSFVLAALMLEIAMTGMSHDFEI
jgi:hypothetical protein